MAIRGATTCGWAAAAAMACRLPPDRYQVVVIADGTTGDGLGDFGPVMALPPMAAAFHEGLGLDVAGLVRASGGVTAAGTALSGWRADGADSFLPYGETGEPLEGVTFRQLAARWRAAGRSIRLVDYAPAALAAQAGREIGPALPRAFYLPGRAYAGALRAVALAHGATEAERLPADPLLVLDASGDDGSAEDWTGWHDLLPCDRLRTQVEPAAAVTYAHVAAAADGWDGIWPLAQQGVRLSVRQGGPGQPFRQGRRGVAWTGNRIRLGAAYCVLEPMHPLGLALLIRQLARLLLLFPATAEAPAAAAEFNRWSAQEADRARDVVAAHYLAAGRRGRWWAARRTVTPPAPLAHKLQLFAARGRLPMDDGEPWEEEDWAAMLDAIGMEPRGHDALADRLSLAEVEAHLHAVRARTVAAVRAMPPLGAHT